MAARNPRKLIAGNWKMNGSRNSLAMVEALRAGAGAGGVGADLLVCPPATLIAPVAQALAGSAIAVGGQDCHALASGAYTGDLSAEMLAEAGATHVIVGHSERREHHGETDAMVRDKMRGAWRAGLVAIACVGETKAQREAGEALAVVGAQVKALLESDVGGANTAIAYEPVWAIGTGLTPTVADVAEVHRLIRATIAQAVGPETAAGVRLLYGGSVKPGNAAELMAADDVDGALVGGASLVADDFLAIARAC
ncbi:MAG: triose-phosphate isomerase [Salinarimonadaceae bacterium]|nr:MAG: triose-phosphate isomerase [Salinarimonadaceae bacterium]